MIGVKKSWLGERKLLNEKINEKTIKTTITGGEEKDLEIMSIYNAGNTCNIIEFLKNLENDNEKDLVIGGDFNIRIGELNCGGEVDLGNTYNVRKSKDHTINNEGRGLANVIDDRRWYVLNGRWEGDRRVILRM